MKRGKSANSFKRVLGGGVIIQAEGSMIGAVGVAGVPGGEMDEKCANVGVEAMQEVLDFL